ncbi:hypothetical protein HDU76_007334, partial [Blyttiomyces sp. JEL0837]
MAFFSGCVVFQAKAYDFMIKGEFAPDQLITIKSFHLKREDLVSAVQPFDKDGYGRLMICGGLKVNLEKNEFEVILSEGYRPIKGSEEGWANISITGLEFQGKAVTKPYHLFHGSILAYNSRSGYSSKPISLVVQVHGLSDETVNKLKLQIGKEGHLQITLVNVAIKNNEDKDPTAYMSGIFSAFSYKEKDKMKTLTNTPKGKFAHKEDYTIDLGDDKDIQTHMEQGKKKANEKDMEKEKEKANENDEETNEDETDKSSLMDIDDEQDE